MGVNVLAVTTPKTNCIQTSVSVINPQNKNVVKTKGIWDTGATNSVITRSTARALGLVPIGITKVNGVHGVKDVFVYRVTIVLNNKNISLTTEVTECEELSGSHDIGMLVGMNIIGMGDFCITNFNGETTMTFRVPSLEKVNYVDEVAEYKRILKIHQAKVAHGIKGDKCACGSGKIWENCHGKSKYRI